MNSQLSGKHVLEASEAGAIEVLQKCLGPGGVITGPEVNSRSIDPFGHEPCHAFAIARPKTTQEVSDVLTYCDQNGLSVVPMGGATGLVGGIRASQSELVLSTERMRGIEDIDPLGRTMTVLSGTPLQAIQEAASEAGFFYPVDLGARGSATIGGNIATNAGGNRVLRYGMTRDQILGLEVVLANGSVLSSLNTLMKNNTGYDLKQLFVGAEGTLGIVTRAVIRLQAEPPGCCVALLAIEDFSSISEVFRELDASGLGLSAFEVMWEDFYSLVGQESSLTIPLPTGSPYYVLVECMGTLSNEEFESKLFELHDRGYLVDAAVANSTRQVEEMWAIRDGVEYVSNALGGVGVGYDVSLPVKEMERYVRNLKEELLNQDSNSKCVVFGHYGDGNLHLIISFRDNAPHHKRRLDHMVYEPLRTVGGSISAEHGIGLLKKDHLPLCKNSSEICVMQGLKKHLDPNGTLNPGKLV